MKQPGLSSSAVVIADKMHELRSTIDHQNAGHAGARNKTPARWH
jgi:hypothetical protein